MKVLRKSFCRPWALLTVAIGIAIAPAVAAKDEPDSRDGGLFHGGCAGTWIGNVFGPDGQGTELVLVERLMPLDPIAARLSYRAEPVNPLGPFAPGVFDEATVVSDGHGQLTRRSRNRYEGRWIGYVSEPPDLSAFTRGEVQWFFIIEFAMECGRETMTQSGLLHVYSAIDDPDIVFPPLGISGVHDQDRDQDGFPDEGENPLVTLPFEKTSRRFDD